MSILELNLKAKKDFEQISVNKLFFYFLILVFLSACASSEKDIEENSNLKDIFEKIEPINEEFNKNLVIELKTLTKGNPFLGNNSNNSGNSDFQNNFKKILSYKFKTIEQFNFTQPELIFTNDNSVIFFDGNGSIF